MEKTISIEDRLKRAEKIHAERYGTKINEIASRKEYRENTNPLDYIERKETQVNTKNKEKSKLKLLKKLITHILVIYLIIYTVNNRNYIFSKEFRDKTKEILTQNINFTEIYQKTKKIVESKLHVNKKENEENTQNTKQQEKPENTVTEPSTTQTTENADVKNYTAPEISEIENKTTFIKPIEGTITSKYGQRNPTTPNVPKNHTGIDISAAEGTKIKSATDGEVVLCSEEGDYGKHIKIQNGEISIIYAHCKKIYVKHGDIVKQGQEIAEVGSTGNSTGPHLHFEVRLREQTVNPEKLITLF